MLKRVIKDKLWRIARFILPDLDYVQTSKRYFEGSLTNSSIDRLAKLYPPYTIVDSTVGKYTYVSQNSIINQTEIGKFCSIGPNLLCGWGIHPIEGLSTSPMFYSTKKQNGFSLAVVNKIQEQKNISIGNDVFIGMNVTILDGVTIGHGAVVGASTLVSKNVPPYAVVAGNPMKILRYRFPEETVKSMLDIEWWNFPDDNLKQVEKDFFEVEHFISSQNKKVSGTQ